MEKNERQFRGVTLTELLVALAVIASLIALSMPARRLLQSSFETTGTKAMISAALATARAIAAKEQHYAGVRFQQDPNGNQYMVFILQDPNVMAYGFRAVGGLKPLKLPEAMGVMDLRIRTETDPGKTDDEPINRDIDIEPEADSSEIKLSDTTTFSIVFSSSGRLVMHNVRIRNRDGYPDTPTNNSESKDDIFNKRVKVDEGAAMFYQDDYTGYYDYPDVGFINFGLGAEPSRKSFVIYDRKHFEQLDKDSRWSNYLFRLQPIYINPYTGTIIVE